MERSFTARPRGRHWRLVAWITGILAFAVLAGGVAVAEELGDARHYWNERAMPGAVVNDVQLAGMTRTEALTAVEEAIAPWVDRTVNLRLGTDVWRTSLRRLGATHDAQAVVNEAIDASRAVSWRTLASVHWQDGTVPFTGRVRIETPVRSVRRFVERVAEQVYVEPQDARVRYSRESVWVEDAVPGRRVLVGPTMDGLIAALEGEGQPGVEIVTEPVQPEVTRSDLRQILFLRQHRHQLDLIVDGRTVRTYPVAVGTSGYRTPTGVYEVTLKRRHPTWVNPDPYGWGADMPARIGPGPNNPLGLRALNWSAPGAIRFHGTAAVDSIGRDASHGCVRLTNVDIVDLFDRVDEGATIVSVR